MEEKDHRYNWMRIKENLEEIGMPELDEELESFEGKIIRIKGKRRSSERVSYDYTFETYDGRERWFFENEVELLTDLEKEVIEANGRIE